MILTNNDYATGPTGISADGRYVVLVSEDPNLVPHDTNARTDLFRYDADTGTMTRLDLTSTGAQIKNGVKATDPLAASRPTAPGVPFQAMGAGSRSPRAAG